MLELIQSDQNLLGEFIGTLLLAGMAALAVLGMRRGFRKREAQARDRYGAVPAAAEPARAPDGEALYVGTTVAGSRAERVALRELWGRWRCAWWAEAGRLVLRGPHGVLELEGVTEVALVGAHAGRAVGRDRIAVVRWTLGGRQVDTGLQFPSNEEAQRFEASITTNGARA